MSTYGSATARIVVGLVLLTSSVLVLVRSQFARWIGYFAATIGALSAMTWMPYYPVWSLVYIGIAVLVFYGLAKHGGREAQVRGVLDQPDRRVRLRRGLGRAVAGGVVDQDDLIVRIGLGAHGGEAFGERRSALVDHHHDTDHTDLRAGRTAGTAGDATSSIGANGRPGDRC